MPVCIPGDQLGGDPDFPQAELREIPCVLAHTDYFFFQLLLLFVAHPLATRHVSSGASGVPRRVKVERRRQKQLSSPQWVGFWEIRTLSGWGARYTAKKARREVSNFA